MPRGPKPLRKGSDPQQALAVQAWQVRLGIALVVALYVTLRLAHLSQYALWYDEVFSVSLCQSGWRQLFAGLIADKIHPPLFYVLLKAWIATVGVGVTRLRLLSVLLSVLAVFPFWKALTTIGISDRLRLALLLAVSTNPFLIFYSQEVRMYVLLWVFATSSLWLYLRAVEKQTRLDLVLLAILNALLVGTHFAGLAIIGSEWAHWRLHRPSRRFFLVAVLPGISVFVVWAGIVVAHQHGPTLAHHVSWIPKPTFKSFYHTVAHLLGGRTEASLVQIPIVIALMYRRFHDQRNWHFLFLFGSVATIAGLFVVSFTMASLWQDRYLIATVTPYYLLFGVSAEMFSKQTTGRWSLLLILAALVALEFNLTHLPDRPSRAAIERFATAVRDGPLLVSNQLVGAPVAFEVRNMSSTTVLVLSDIALSERGEARLHVRKFSPTQEQRVVTQVSSSPSGQESWLSAPKAFGYAYDAHSSAEIELGISPNRLLALGCSLKPIGATRGQGHRFAFYEVHC